MTSSAIAKDEWRITSPRGGNFSIAMPGAPSYRVQRVPTVEGTLALHIFTLDRGARVYIVSYADHKKIPTRAGLRGGASAWAAAGRPMALEDAKKQGWPAASATFKRGRYFGRAVAVGVKRRVYQVVFMTRQKSDISVTGKRYFGSLKLSSPR